MTLRSVWILGRWIDLPTGANWEITAAFETREEAVSAGRPDEFVARLPLGGRSGLPNEVFPDAEWLEEANV